MVTWKEVPRDVVVDVVLRVEGNVLYKPDLLRGLGVPDPLVNRYVKTFRSNPDLGPSGVLYGPDGKQVDAVVGCHGIEILRDVAKEFGVPLDRSVHVHGRVCNTHLEGCIIQFGLRKVLDGWPDALAHQED